MNSTAAVSNREASPFPLWHTAVLLAILAALVAMGAQTHGALHRMASHKLTEYLIAATFEWVMAGWIIFGCRIKGQSLSSLLGACSSRWQTILRDIGLAIAYLIVANIVLGILKHFVSGPPTEALKRMLPQTPLQQAVFVGLAITAGFCEELIFRGYFQRQFTAWTGSISIAVILQAIVFGLGHLYQGLGQVLVISVYGAMFGLLATWRMSLRPGIIAHMLQDAVSGLLAARSILK